jgi:hypothetical protein
LNLSISQTMTIRDRFWHVDWKTPLTVPAYITFQFDTAGFPRPPYVLQTMIYPDYPAKFLVVAKRKDGSLVCKPYGTPGTT